MTRWVTKTVGGNEVLRAREGRQFSWAGTIYPEDFIGLHSDAELQEMGFAVVTVEEYTPPEPERPVVASRLQFFKALALRGLISQAEALAAVTVNAIPSRLRTAIDDLPPSERFDAEITVAGATEFDSRHPLTLKLGGQLMAADALPEFFAFARKL